MEPKDLVTALAAISLTAHTVKMPHIYPAINPPPYVTITPEDLPSPHSEEGQSSPMTNAHGVAYVYGYINPNASWLNNKLSRVGFPTLGIPIQEL